MGDFIDEERRIYKKKGMKMGERNSWKENLGCREGNENDVGEDEDGGGDVYGELGLWGLCECDSEVDLYIFISSGFLLMLNILWEKNMEWNFFF